MIRLSLVFVFIFKLNLLVGQDIYSYDNSKKFGEYLLKSGQYNLAAKEYEKLVFLNNDDDSLKLNLFKAFRLSNQLEVANFKYNQIFKDKSTMNNSLAIEYSKFLMQKRDWKIANDFWNNSKYLSNDEKVFFKTTVDIFESNFKQAKIRISETANKEDFVYLGYSGIIKRGQTSQLKKPFVGGLLSVIVPGLGKGYSKNWKDGIFSFLFTTTMSLQAARSFNKFGTNNPRGWVYGGIASGFYLGNIYGSVRSTKQYNEKKINILKHEASDIFNSQF
jgi:hypothetical protein